MPLDLNILEELAVIYDSNKLIIEHSPKKKVAFDEPFLADTLESDIHERYEHRPPLECTVKDKNNSGKVMLDHSWC